MPSQRSSLLTLVSYLPVVVVLVGLVLLARMAEDLSRERLLSDLRVSTANRLGVVRTNLEGGISGPLQLTRDLAAALAIEPAMPQERFTALARAMLNDQPQVRNVAAAPDLVLRYVYPLEGNEAILGVDYRTVPRQWEAAQRARDTGRLTLAGPVPLIQGGTGLIARLAVYTEPEAGTGNRMFWGMVACVLDVDRLLTLAGLTDPALPIEIAIRGADGLGAEGATFFGRADLFDDNPVLLDVAVPNGTWQMAAVPRGGWESGLPSLWPVHMGFAVAGGLILVPLIVTARLLEERRRTLVRLARSEERYRRLFEQSEDPSWVIVDRRFVMANDAARRVLGYASVEDLLGRRPADLSPPEQPDGQPSASKARALFDQAESQGYHRFEWLHLRRDGSPLPVEVSLSKIPHDEHGTAILCIWRDISERKAAEARLVQTVAALERSNAELQQFAYVASHDLQEPLRVVTSFLQLLERRLGPVLDQETRDYIAFAVDGARRMRQLILDLLAYSRLTLEETETEVVDLDRVAAEVMAALRPSLEEAGGTATLDPLPVVLGNSVQLASLMQNLIGNAIKYREPTRPLHVAVTCREDGDHWHLTVADNGIGIAPEYRERIFVIFQRLHARASGGAPIHDGTGIGLALCKKIIERHQGRLWVEGAVGVGSAFHFTLPRTLSTPSATESLPPPAA